MRTDRREGPGRPLETVTGAPQRSSTTTAAQSPAIWGSVRLGLILMGYGHYFETYRKESDGGWRISPKRNVRLRVDQVPRTLPS